MPEGPRRTFKASDHPAFFRGAAVLTLGTLLVKLLGALYKIPLTRMLGPEGFGHFGAAYSVFALLLTLSTAGLPVAMSRMVARYETLGDRSGQRRVLRVGLRLFLGLGGLSSAGMLIFAPQLARFMRDPEAMWAMAVLAPSVVLLGISSALRGYFQGRQDMTPTAVSQVLEAAAKLLLGLGAAALLLSQGRSPGEAAGGAISGVTLGAALSAGFLALTYRARRPRDLPRLSGPGDLPAAKELICLAVPITLGAGGSQLVSALSGRLILGRLQDLMGLSAREAAARYGLLSGAMTFSMLPGALVLPLTVSIIPAITGALTLGDFRGARRTGEAALSGALMGLVPCAAGMALLAAPLLALAYGYRGETLDAAASILRWLTLGAPFAGLGAVCAAILQAHGRVLDPIRATALGGSVTLGACWVLLPVLGISGGAAAMALGSCVTLCGSLRFLRRHVPEPPDLLPLLPGPAAAAAVMAWTVAGCLVLARRLGLPAIPAAALSIPPAAAVYGGMLLILGGLPEPLLRRLRRSFETKKGQMSGRVSGFSEKVKNF